jgi:hypothetical protein
MADFLTVLNAHNETYKYGLSQTRKSLQRLNSASLINQFLTNHGFTDIEIAGEGTNALVLADKQNPSLAIRITHLNEFARPIIPQILQPIHSIVMEDAGVKIEFIRNLFIQETNSSLPQDQVDGYIEGYKDEVFDSGYEVNLVQNLVKDCGLYTYDDPKRPGKTKSVFIGADASTIVQDDPVLTAQPPTCTADYPTLEDQWRENCKIVEADPRLKQMIGGLPPKLPVTRVIPSISSARTP